MAPQTSSLYTQNSENSKSIKAKIYQKQRSRRNLNPKSMKSNFILNFGALFECRENAKRKKRKYNTEFGKGKALFRALSLGFLINQTRMSDNQNDIFLLCFFLFFSQKPNTCREKSKTTSLLCYGFFLFYLWIFS